MGCEFNFKKLSAKTADEAKKEGYGVIDQAAYECGHGGYTGSFAECNGVEVVAAKFDSVDAAHDWLDDNAEKWGAMLIVEVTGEQACFCAGANCSS